jgi:hypothetical protein
MLNDFTIAHPRIASESDKTGLHRPDSIRQDGGMLTATPVRRPAGRPAFAAAVANGISDGIRSRCLRADTKLIAGLRKWLETPPPRQISIGA